MNELERLIARRANTWEQYQEVLGRADGENGFAAEDRESLDRLETEISEQTADIERMQRGSALQHRFDEIDRSQIPDGGGSSEDRSETERRDEAFTAYLRRGMGGLTPEQRELIEPGEALRAQGVGVDAEGGFLVPEGFRLKFQEALKFFGGMRQVAESITTTQGNKLPWPTNDDTANKGAILAENTQVVEQNVVLGQKVLEAFMYTSKLVRVSIQLIQDTAFPIDSWLPRKLGERIGRIHNEHFTKGTGIGQPEGVQTNATVGKTGAVGQTTSVTYDDLVDLKHSVDVAYRNERAAWMMHDLTVAAIRKLKDADNRPIWEPSVQAGQPDTLLGFRVQINNDMPVMAASAKSILFGDYFAGYVIRDVRAIQALRLTERYADFLQVGFLGFGRADGTPQDATAYKAYSNSAT